jgi:hypothetical protein
MELTCGVCCCRGEHVGACVVGGYMSSIEVGDELKRQVLEKIRERNASGVGEKVDVNVVLSNIKTELARSMRQNPHLYDGESV